MRSKAAIGPGAWPCDTATVPHDTTLGATTRAAARDTVHAHGLGAGCVAIQPATRSARLATRLTRPTTRLARLATRPGSATIRPGRGATTRPSGRHDTEPSARPGRSGRAGWARVCTWCTQPSFDSVHCSESLFGTLFGTLFMSTVHEVLKKNKNKITSNQIKFFKIKRNKIKFSLNMI